MTVIDYQETNVIMKQDSLVKCSILPVLICKHPTKVLTKTKKILLMLIMLIGGINFPLGPYVFHYQIM